MQAKILRIALFIGLLLSMSPLTKGAALSNASLQGTYFFVLQEIDPSVFFGFYFTTAQGTLTFDQKGNVAVKGQINRGGTVESLSATGTYNLGSSGSVHVSLPDIPLSVDGDVSFDLNSLIASNVASGVLYSQEILLATKQLPLPISTAFLNGKYFLAERTVTASGGIPSQFENATGTISFDGQGNCAVALSSNRNGSLTPANATGTYLMASDGGVLLNLPGRSTPVKLGFTPDGNMGVGATVQSQSSATHDLFAVTRANN